MSEEKDREQNGKELSRRRFLKETAAAGGATILITFGFPKEVDAACNTPISGSSWPSIVGWEHRTVMHYINAIFPGNDGQQLFYGDGYPLKSGGDRTAGAFSACVLDVFYDPYYGVAGTNSNLIAAALDWAVRAGFDATYFYKASQAAQLRAIDRLTDLIFVGPGFLGANTLALGSALGAFQNYSAVAAIGWPGPNGGYYESAKHPSWRWQRPARMTSDGNLP